MSKLAFITLLVAFTSGCSAVSGPVVYNWRAENVGMAQFVEDHDACMESSDLLPDWPDWLTFGTKKLNTRADWDGRGIWASYVPYVGAEPVLVNSNQKDFATSTTAYSGCMRVRGYRTRRLNLHEASHIKRSLI